jgi:hypothetical protein
MDLDCKLFQQVSSSSWVCGAQLHELCDHTVQVHSSKEWETVWPVSPQAIRRCLHHLPREEEWQGSGAPEVEDSWRVSCSRYPVLCRSWKVPRDEVPTMCKWAAHGVLLGSPFWPLQAKRQAPWSFYGVKVSGSYVDMHFLRTSLILIWNGVMYYIILESRMSVVPQHHLCPYRVLPLILSLQPSDAGLRNALPWYRGQSWCWLVWRSIEAVFDVRRQRLLARHQRLLTRRQPVRDESAAASVPCSRHIW